MSEVKNDVITKCRQCDEEMITGQRFCTECGAKQDVPMRTKDEILEMRKHIFKLGKPEKDKMIMSLVSMMTVDTVLGWVLGYRSDIDIVKLITGKFGENKEGGGDKA